MNRRYLGSSTRTALDNDKIRTLAPAVFAESADQDLSARYSFLPTIAVVEALRKAGWVPVFAAQSRARDPENKGVQRHIVRFSHPDMLTAMNVGDTVPELAVENSHDGSSSYLMSAALFRKACTNGLMVSDGTLEAVRVRHTGRTVDDVIEGAFEVIRDVPKLAGSVEAMRSVTLAPEERLALAESAALVRWQPSEMPIEPSALLRVRRVEDKAPDLFTTLNVIQENVIRGGVRGRSKTGHRMSTRAVASVSEDSRLNKALWTLAERMRALKTGAAA